MLFYKYHLYKIIKKKEVNCFDLQGNQRAVQQHPQNLG
nr:MAG TPA: hypothetical protein [Microviridae sp.]